MEKLSAMLENSLKLSSGTTEKWESSFFCFIYIVIVIISDETVLYVSRMEPSQKLNILPSSSFFERQIDTRVDFTGAREIEKKEEYLFAVTDDDKKPGNKKLYVAKAE